MSSDSDEYPQGERIIIASAASVCLLYVAFLILDIVNGWGLGFVVFFWILISVALFLLLSVCVVAWRWVWRGSPKRTFD